MDIRKLSAHAFLVFLFFLPFQTVLLLREPFVGGEKWQYGTIGLYGTDILLFLLLVVWAVNRGRGRNRKQETTNEIGTTEVVLMLVLLWSGLSITWAGDQVLALYFSIKLALAIGVFFLARSIDDAGAKTTVKVLLAAAVLQAMIGIGQFMTQSTFSSSLLGMGSHESWQAGTSVLKNEGGRWLRAYGSLPHPNILGGFLGATLVLGISYYVSPMRSVVANGRIIRTFRILYLVSCSLLLLGLILTFSRTAWGGAIIGIGAIPILQVTRNKKQETNFSYRIFGVLTIALLVFVGILHETVFPRFDGATIGREGSVSERALSLEDARTLVALHPFLGVGGGNSTAAVIESEPDRPIWSIQPAHNVFALVFAELGIVGLVLFSIFLGSSLYRLGSGTDPTFAIAFLALIPILLLDHWLWTSHFGILILFLFAGLATRDHETAK